MKKAGSANDPLWYKDAVIYELHVKAFNDSNNDGIGDFPGVTEKLDYLQDLGVTCLWILPFFPSPQRDDGYDISDYVDVNPAYGTLDDFKTFLNEAHQRGMQVMIELVINHSSDQHPWFQRARLAPPGSPERDFYVWSDTDQKFKGTRIIFTDTEKSNWTWDDEAGAYYWHRFFSHQPDLNFDNPQVLEEVLNAMRFWMDMGVDGLRLDAIPYLVEREGTSNENVPETHVIIKKIRAVIDAEYENRMILAEANMWPDDVRPYFGDGDECHMAFHFPLMPRIYMALRQEDRLPITDIMARTPAIPDLCQWGLFLRNHDELTLEMVTDDERDYMYLAYSADPRMRINVGIRRRLAPLVDNNRRRIELLNSLLFSFPGTPILYYGDEIGMGDNIYLGDRNGVRTPMQWNSDRNAGFSKATPGRLYSPVIMDPIWGYQAINVEAQQQDTSSLLHWTRNMIALRKLFQVFGRGTLEFLAPENRKVLAYLREFDGEKVVCVANLSRFAQPVSLDLSRFEGMVPVEMLGYVFFPPIKCDPYPLTLAPYSFLWLELQAAPEVPEDAATKQQQEDPALDLLAQDNTTLFTGPSAPVLQEKLLPTWLIKQRWFSSKSRTIQSTKIVDWADLPEVPDASAALAILEVHYADSTDERYSLPLATRYGEAVDALRENFPEAVLTSINSPTGNGVLHNALIHEEVRRALFALITTSSSLKTIQGELTGIPSKTLQWSAGTAITSRVGSAEQSNTSILFGDRYILKLFRKLQLGENPDVEISRFLTEEARFNRIAPFFGEIAYNVPGQETTTLAMLQGLVANEGDGWKWTLDDLSRYYESCATSLSSPDVEAFAGPYLQSAAVLGQRTAEMHRALATPTSNLAFSVEPFTKDALQVDSDRLAQQIRTALDLLRRNISALPEEVEEPAAFILSNRHSLMNQAKAIIALDPTRCGDRTRIHGDYHLGQVLRVQNDFVLLDFEGEPARPLTERRQKQSPLRDVAGMLRSFSYAAFAGLDHHVARRPESRDALQPCVIAWEQAACKAFLEGYNLPQTEETKRLVNGYLLEKALYELMYELNNRPAWVSIPLAGILNLLQSS